MGKGEGLKSMPVGFLQKNVLAQMWQDWFKTAKNDVKLECCSCSPLLVLSTSLSLSMADKDKRSPKLGLQCVCLLVSELDFQLGLL